MFVVSFLYHILEDGHLFYFYLDFQSNYSCQINPVIQSVQYLSKLYLPPGMKWLVPPKQLGAVKP